MSHIQIPGPYTRQKYMVFTIGNTLCMHIQYFIVWIHFTETIQHLYSRDFKHIRGVSIMNHFSGLIMRFYKWNVYRQPCIDYTKIMTMRQ